MKLLIEKQYHRLRKFWAPMALHLSHIARYAPSIQNHIHLKTFSQILAIVFKQPLSKLMLHIANITEFWKFYSAYHPDYVGNLLYLCR